MLWWRCLVREKSQTCLKTLMFLSHFLAPSWWLLFSRTVKEVAFCCGFPDELQAVYYKSGVVFLVGGGGRNSKHKAQRSTTHSQNYNLFTTAKQTKNVQQYRSIIGCIGMAHVSLIAAEIFKKSDLKSRCANFQKSKLEVCTYRAEMEM